MWAGIVKELAQKIEKEFGFFTTRLFRAISLKSTPEPDYRSKECSILLEFTDGAPQSEEEWSEKKDQIEKDCGPTENCWPYLKWKEDKKMETGTVRDKSCLVVEFKDAAAAQKAYKKLKTWESLKVYLLLPTTNENEEDEKKHKSKSRKNPNKSIAERKIVYRTGNILGASFCAFIVCSSITLTVLAFEDHVFGVIIVFQYVNQLRIALTCRKTSSFCRHLQYFLC